MILRTSVRSACTLITLLALAFACAAAPPHTFRITGVAISARDGAPIPYCRISASLVPANQIGTARPAGPSSQRGPAGPQQNGGRPGGGGRQMGGGFGGRDSSISTTPQTTADASGKFSLELPRAGAWMLSAAARAYRSQNYDEHEGFFSAVVLTEAAPTFALTFRLLPDSMLTGLIIDDAGEPVAQAQVVAELVPLPVPGTSADAERPRPAGFAQTDDRGHYEIIGLQPGKYRLRVQATPWYAASSRGGDGPRPAPTTTPATVSLDPPLDFVYPITWFPGTDNEQEAQVLALGPGEDRQADFHLTAIPSVHLRIPRLDSGNPQPAENGRGRQQQQQRPQVMISRVSTEGGQGGFAEPLQGGFNGTDFDFGGLTPGIYEIRMPGPDGRPGGEVRQIEIGSGSQSVISLDAAKSLIPVTLRFEGGGLPQPTVEFVDIETGRRLANSPSRGRRGFPGGGDDDDAADDPPAATRTVMLPPHSYEVYIQSSANDYLTGMTATGAKILGRVITVTGAATLTLHVASGRAQVEGVARLQDRPSAGAMVMLVPVTLGQPGNLATILRDETNTDGTFLINGATPGRYILVAIDHGWDVDWRTPEGLARYLIHGIPVELRAGAKAHEEIDAVEH